MLWASGGLVVVYSYVRKYGDFVIRYLGCHAEGADTISFIALESARIGKVVVI